jgi:S1-C subfamily serine protease
MVQVGNAVIPAGGDVVTALEGAPVASSEELIRAIRKQRPGDQVRLRVLRDGKSQDVALVLGERPRGR